MITNINNLTFGIKSKYPAVPRAELEEKRMHNLPKRRIAEVF